LLCINNDYLCKITKGKGENVYQRDLLINCSQTLSFEVEGDDQVSTLKQKVQEREGIPLASIKLAFAGKVLEAGNVLSSHPQKLLNLTLAGKLSDHGIGKESIVHLIEVIIESFLPHLDQILTHLDSCYYSHNRVQGEISESISTHQSLGHCEGYQEV
jgi:hypothetical protein